MYKGASRGQQSRTDKGITQTKSGRLKRPKTGKPKSKLHARLESGAADAQRVTWLRYIARCEESGTVPVIPADIRRKLGI